VPGRVNLVGFRLGHGSRRSVIAREDWTLLVIAASDGLHPVQMQKALFLLGQRHPEVAENGFYEFRPVAGGDFSEQIYADAHALARKGLVSVRFSDEDGSRRYQLKAPGVERAKSLEKQVDPALSRSLRNLVSWVGNRSVDQLLRPSSELSRSIKPRPGSRGSVRSS
jgi:hypothetical protein